MDARACVQKSSSNRGTAEEDEEEKMQLYLKIIKTVSLNVKRSMTIENVKTLLHENEGIPEHVQELFFTGDHLKDGQKLEDYGIPENSTLHIVLQNSVSIKLHVSIPSNQKTIVVEARIYDTIQTIKSMILMKEGIQSDLYALFFAGKLLEDNMTLASLKIQGNATFHLIFNPRDVLPVSVKLPSGRIVKLEVKVLYTVRDVKAIVGSLVGSPAGKYNLYLAEKQLEDTKTLSFYNIREESFLVMLPATIQIFIKDWSSKTITLVVRPQNTVGDVKNKIFHKLGVPVHVQGLVFAGKYLEEERNLASYNIQKDCTLHMVIRSSVDVQSFEII